MGAITRQYGFEEALRLALLAGCDLLCLSNNGDSYNPDLVPRAVQAITQFVKNGELSADDIHAAADPRPQKETQATLKLLNSLIPKNQPTSPTQDRKWSGLIALQENRK